MSGEFDSLYAMRRTTVWPTPARSRRACGGVATRRQRVRRYPHTSGYWERGEGDKVNWVADSSARSDCTPDASVASLGEKQSRDRAVIPKAVICLGATTNDRWSSTRIVMFPVHVRRKWTVSMLWSPSMSGDNMWWRCFWVRRRVMINKPIGSFWTRRSPLTSPVTGCIIAASLDRRERPP